MPVASVASPPDISAILTSLGVFSLAIAAVVGGIYQGIKQVKKGGEDTDKSVAGAVIMDRGSMQRLSDSNDRLVTVNTDILATLRQIDHKTDRLIEALQDSRGTTRSQTEEQHRLRAAIVDLVEIMRRFRV